MVQIRNVPEALHRQLKSRAALAGMSLSDFLLSEIRQVTERPTIDELRARYTIGYRPSNAQPAGIFCKIHVELAPDGRLRPKEWRVLARQGYYRK